MDNLAAEKQSSGDVSKLLSRILTRQLEKHNQMKEKDVHRLQREKLNINELVRWEVWPIMMKITCKLSCHNKIMRIIIIIIIIFIFMPNVMQVFYLPKLMMILLYTICHAGIWH